MAEAALRAATDALVPANAQRNLAKRIENAANANGIGDLGLQQLEQSARAARTLAEAAEQAAAGACTAAEAALEEVQLLIRNAEGAASQQAASCTLPECKQKVMYQRAHVHAHAHVTCTCTRTCACYM